MMPNAILTHMNCFILFNLGLLLYGSWRRYSHPILSEAKTCFYFILFLLIVLMSFSFVYLIPLDFRSFQRKTIETIGKCEKQQQSHRMRTAPLNYMQKEQTKKERIYSRSRQYWSHQRMSENIFQNENNEYERKTEIFDREFNTIHSMANSTKFSNNSSHLNSCWVLVSEWNWWIWMSGKKKLN